MMKSDGVPKTKPKRRTITINRDAAVLDALDNQARANKCNTTPDFLLMCANAYSAAVDLQSSAALGHGSWKQSDREDFRRLPTDDLSPRS